LLVLFFILLFFSSVSAQERTPYLGSGYSTTITGKTIDLFYNAHLEVVLEKNSFSAGEELKGKIVLLNLEEFPIPEAYIVLEVVQGEDYYYPSQLSDRDNIFIEEKLSNINLSPSERHEIDFSIKLPSDLAAGSYRLDAYAKAEKPLLVGIPQILLSPVTNKFTVLGNDDFPQAKIVRTKTKFHSFLGPIGPGIQGGEEISNNVFVVNTSKKELKNLKLLVSLCEWDDTACKKFDSVAEEKIDSLAPGQEKSVSVKLAAPLQPDAYAIRIELRNSENKLLSLYRNRSIVYGPTAKIHKLFVSDFLFNNGEDGSITVFVGPTPDHYLREAFSNFDLKVSIEDLRTGKSVFSDSERIPEIGRKEIFEIDFIEKKFDFVSVRELDFFKVCGSIEKQQLVHELYCFVVDASKFRTKELFSEIGANWSYLKKERKLDVEFFLFSPETSTEADAAFSLTDFSSNNLLGDGTLSSPLPKKVSFSDIGLGSFTLVLNNFLTKKQSRFEINTAALQAAVPVQEKTCSALNGFVCRTIEACKGELLPAADAAICCSTACIERPAVGVQPLPVTAIDSSILFFVAIIVLLALFYLWKKRREQE